MSAWTDSELETATEMWNAFATQDQISAAMGKTIGSVSFHLTKLGLRGRKRRPGEPPSKGRVWTDDEVGDLRRLWAAQNTKFQIAEVMGRSPGAVLNKASEVGLTGAKKLRTALPLVDVAPLPVRRELPLVPPAKSCQWLESEPSERNFCGQPSEPGVSYCATHRAVCLIPLVPRLVKEVAV